MGAEERCSPALQIRLEHSGHSGSLTGSWRHISFHAPLLPYPIPIPGGTSPASQEPTGKDEGNEIGDVVASHLPICPERVLETSHPDFVGAMPHLGPQ